MGIIFLNFFLNVNLSTRQKRLSRDWPFWSATNKVPYCSPWWLFSEVRHKQSSTLENEWQVTPIGGGSINDILNFLNTKLDPVGGISYYRSRCQVDSEVQKQILTALEDRNIFLDATFFLASRWLAFQEDIIWEVTQHNGYFLKILVIIDHYHSIIGDHSAKSNRSKQRQNNERTDSLFLTGKSERAYWIICQSVQKAFLVASSFCHMCASHQEQFVVHNKDSDIFNSKGRPEFINFNSWKAN